MSSIRQNIFITLLLMAFLSACSSGTSGSYTFENTPIETATPEIIQTTAPATPTLLDATEATMPLTQQTPLIVDQPTPDIPAVLTEAFNDQDTPAALVNIYKPGPNSQVVSPINMSAYAYPGEQQKVTVQLFGEDGRLMADQLIKLTVADNGWSAFSSRIPFEINSAGESALLSVSIFDGFGRRIAVNSVPLILLQVGESEIEPANFQNEPFPISSPGVGSIIKGNSLHVEGLAHPFNQNPVVIELIKENGAIISSKIVPIETTSGNEEYVPFSADVPFDVSESTPVRLTIRQVMDHAPYLDLALSSITIILKPK